MLPLYIYVMTSPTEKTPHRLESRDTHCETDCNGRTIPNMISDFESAGIYQNKTEYRNTLH